MGVARLTRMRNVVGLVSQQRLAAPQLQLFSDGSLAISGAKSLAVDHPCRRPEPIVPISTAPLKDHAMHTNAHEVLLSAVPIFLLIQHTSWPPVDRGSLRCEDRKHINWI